jgi:IS30 family transposase
MDRISDAERQRIAELLAEGAPVWQLHEEINRSRFAIRRAVVALHRPPRREPRRSPLRLSLAEREEISRRLAASEPTREIARRLGGPRRRCAGRWRRTAAGTGTGRARRTGGRSG